MRVVQSVLISNKKYNLNQAIKKLGELGFKYNKVDIKDKYYRFRQVNPIKDSNYITYKKGEGIKYIIMYK